MVKPMSSNVVERKLHSHSCDTGMSNGLPIQPHTQILVLNNSYEPINITNWKRAIVLLIKGESCKYYQVESIRLFNYIRIPFAKIVAQTPSRAKTDL